MRTNYILNEKEINELLEEINMPKKYDSSSSNENSGNYKYLKMKRKRSPDNNNIHDNNKPVEIIEKVEKKESSPNIVDDTHKTIKFQNFSKYILFIITSYLRIDDLLKLKNVGSRRLSLLINEIYEMMKNTNNNFSLNEIKNTKNHFINDYDSLLCKKYTIINMYKKNLMINKFYTVKYALYHPLTNKNYYICHCLFYYYLCSSDVDIENESKNGENSGQKEEESGSMIEGQNDVLIKLPSKDFYEKFQFLDEYKEGEIAIFALQKILLYNIHTKQRDHSIFLSSSCDHISYRKELKLLLVPIAYVEIEFFKIYASYKKITKSIHILNIKENIDNKNMSNCVDILNIKDFINHNNNNLICTYCFGGTKIIIFDCKSMKIIKEINCKSKLNNINIDNNKNYIIAFTQDKCIKYYSINNNEYSFISSFNLNNICKTDNIKYISLLNSIYINNVFIIFVHIPNKKIIKPFFLYLEYLEEKKGKNDFIFSYIPLKNEISDQIIYDKLFIEKNDNKSINTFNFFICDLSIKDNNKNSKKEGLLIKEYSINI